MYYTQVELTAPKNRESETWWLPVPEDRAKVGEKITRTFNVSTAPDEEGAKHGISITEEWTITQVCTTLREEDLRELILNAKIAEGFERESQTLAYMKM